MDGRTITDAMVAIDEELAVLNRRRQLLSELLTTFQIAPSAAKVEGDRPAPTLPAIGSSRMPKAAKKPAKPAPTKWDYEAVAEVARANGMSAAEVGRHYDVTIDMGRYLIRQCRIRGLLDEKPAKAKPAPIARVDGQFTPEGVAAMLGGAA